MCGLRGVRGGDQLDKASAKLAEFSCTGEHISEIVLTLNRAGGDKVEYMRYTLRDAIVSSVQVSGTTGTTGGAALPVEEVQFNYGEIEWEYTQQKRADGTGGGKVASGWSLEKNKKI